MASKPKWAFDKWVPESVAQTLCLSQVCREENHKGPGIEMLWYIIFMPSGFRKIGQKPVPK